MVLLGCLVLINIQLRMIFFYSTNVDALLSFLRQLIFTEADIECEHSKAVLRVQLRSLWHTVKVFCLFHPKTV